MKGFVLFRIRFLRNHVGHEGNSLQGHFGRVEIFASFVTRHIALWIIAQQSGCPSVVIMYIPGICFCKKCGHIVSEASRSRL